MIKTLQNFLEKHKEYLIKRLERLDHWWNKYAKPQIIIIDPYVPYLDNRIIFCVDCNHNSTLIKYSGVMVCSSCTSSNWMYPAFSRFAWQKNKKIKLKNPYKNHIKL